MASIDLEKLERTLTLVVKLLVDREFKKLSALANGVWFSEDDLRKAIDGYPNRLVIPSGVKIIDAIDPDEDIIEVIGTIPPCWRVIVDLWDVDGRSDLTLVLEVIDGGGILYPFRIGNLRVL